MAFTEFYCNASTGANVNGGSDAGSPSMSDTAGTGAVSTVTHQYTSVATNGSVAVGQFISIYSGAATVAAFTSRITAVSGGSGSVWVITYSTTAISGTEPTTAGTYKAQVGGAWKGPNGTVSFPFNYIKSVMMNGSGHSPRVNLKNNASYAISAKLVNAIANDASAIMYFQGYTTSPGDKGRAVIDAGGGSFTVFENTSNEVVYADLEFTNNSSATGVSDDGAGVMYLRCVAHDVGNDGFLLSNSSIVLECSAYSCNLSGDAGGYSGMRALVAGALFARCVSRDNGVNALGFSAVSTVTFENCLSANNGSHGFAISGSGGARLDSCDSYDNTGDGLLLSSSYARPNAIENCNFVKNGGYGINLSSGTPILAGVVSNCGFGSGSMANTSGATNIAATAPIIVAGSVTYASGVTPWVDPDNGDFRINLAAAKGTGLGAFTPASGFSTTIGYPDIGAAQHLDSGGGGGSPIGLGSPVIRAAQ